MPEKIGRLQEDIEKRKIRLQEGERIQCACKWSNQKRLTVYSECNLSMTGPCTAISIIKSIKGLDRESKCGVRDQMEKHG